MNILKKRDFIILLNRGLKLFDFLKKKSRWILRGKIYFFSIVLMPSEEKLATFPQFCDALRKSFPSF